MNFKAIALIAGGFLLAALLRPAPAAYAEDKSGLRIFAADLLWVRAYTWWERQDAGMTTQTLWQVVKLDPAPLLYWLNGARMIAYDMPVWRGSEDARERKDVRAHINEDQALQALRYLRAARQIYPDKAALWIEQANIELNRLHDLAAAASSYRRAAESSDAPYYAARIYAEILRKAGRKQEAYTWLRQLYPTLPAADPEADAPLVLSRLRLLERELMIPEEQRFQAGGH